MLSHSQIKQELQRIQRKRTELRNTQEKIARRKAELTEKLSKIPGVLAEKMAELEKLKEHARKVAAEHQSLLQQKKDIEEEQKAAHEDEMQVESDSFLDLSALRVIQDGLVEELKALEEKWKLVEQALDKGVEDRANELISLDAQIKALDAEISKLKQEKEKVETELAVPETVQAASSKLAEAKSIEVEAEVSAGAMPQQALSTNNQLSQGMMASSVVIREDKDAQEAKQADVIEIVSTANLVASGDSDITVEAEQEDAMTIVSTASLVANGDSDVTVEAEQEDAMTIVSTASLVASGGSDVTAEAKQAENGKESGLLAECINIAQQLHTAVSEKNIENIVNKVAELDAELIKIQASFYLHDPCKSRLQNKMLAIASECESDPEINKAFGKALVSSFKNFKRNLSILRLFLYSFESRNQLNKFCKIHQLKSIQKEWGDSWDERQRNAKNRSHQKPQQPAKKTDLLSSSSSSPSSRAAKVVKPSDQDRLKRKFQEISLPLHKSWTELSKTSLAKTKDNVASIDAFLSKSKKQVEQYIGYEKEADKESKNLCILIAHNTCRLFLNVYQAQDAKICSEIADYEKLIEPWSEVAWYVLIILNSEKDASDRKRKYSLYETLLKRQYKIFSEKNSLISAQHLKGWQEDFLPEYLNQLEKKLGDTFLATWTLKMVLALNHWNSEKARVSQNSTLYEEIDKIMWHYLEHMEKVAREAPGRPDDYPYESIKEGAYLVKEIKELIQIENYISLGKEIRELIQTASSSVREKLEKLEELVHIENSVSLRKEIGKLIQAESISLGEKIEKLIQDLNEFIDLVEEGKNAEHQSRTAKRRKTIHTVYREESLSSSKIDEESDEEDNENEEEASDCSNQEEISHSDNDDDNMGKEPVHVSANQNMAGERLSQAFQQNPRLDVLAQAIAVASTAASTSASSLSSSSAFFAQPPKSAELSPSLKSVSHPPPVTPSFLQSPWTVLQVHQSAPHPQVTTRPSLLWSSPSRSAVLPLPIAAHSAQPGVTTVTTESPFFKKLGNS